MPECVYKAFHTWELDDGLKRGVVWKLRSLDPQQQHDPE
jgi:hypothetical protein